MALVESIIFPLLLLNRLGNHGSNMMPLGTKGLAGAENAGLSVNVEVHGNMFANMRK
jgi:hypothetical protein